MRARKVLIGLALVVGGVALGALARPLAGIAQTATATPAVDIEGGPGGMWIVRGDRVYVCSPDVIMRGNTPGAPACGPATLLH